MENTTKGTYLMLDILVGIVGIVVTIISVIVTLISIIQTHKKRQTSKKQPLRSKLGCFFDKSFL